MWRSISACVARVPATTPPARYLREGRVRTLFAPSTVLNYGVAPGWEGVVEGQVAHSLSGYSAGANSIST
jgi:hypothetical protein